MGKAAAAASKYTYAVESALKESLEKPELNWREIEEKLKNTLDEDRYRHTLGVSYTAAAMAMAHKTDVQKARLAGLLHDCAKCIPKEERIPLCEENDIEITQTERNNVSLLHSKLGVYIAKKDYGIDDPEIASAIRWHTTGRPAMTKLEQIIYLADCIEPNRDDEMTVDPQVRQYAFTDLDKCCRLIMESVVDYIRAASKEMDEMTLNAYVYYKDLTDGKGD